MERYEGRVVLITGAGSGIGRATVLRLVDEGATVVAADISSDGLATTAEDAWRSPPWSVM
jgi:NAD(P)-dependent dehydrogenase (short-subunit alcohol dehydrogenase family)